MADISEILSSIGISPTAQGLGAITQNGFSQNLSSALNGSANTVNAANSTSSNPNVVANQSTGGAGDWNPTRYASAIASGLGMYDPKTKFLFKVSFNFDPDVIAQASSYGFNLTALSNELTFIVKQIDLPKYTFEYEDVNLYNFRTKILKQTRHEDLTFVMFDDVGNRAIGLINAYIQILVPISRSIPTASLPLGDHGFAFATSYHDLDTSMRGTLGTSDSSKATGIFTTITVTQYYLNRDNKGSLTDAILANTHTFSNPRLTHCEIADQDHEQGSTPNLVSCGFDFDTVNIETGSLGVNETGVPELGTGDILSGASSASTAPSTNQAGGNFGSGNRSAVSSSGSSVGSANVQNLIGQATSGISPGGALGAVNGPLSAYGTAAAKTLSSQSRGIAQGIALPTSPILSDNTVSPSQVSDLSSQIGSSSGMIA